MVNGPERGMSLLSCPRYGLGEGKQGSPRRYRLRIA